MFKMHWSKPETFLKCQSTLLHHHTNIWWNQHRFHYRLWAYKNRHRYELTAIDQLSGFVLAVPVLGKPSDSIVTDPLKSEVSIFASPRIIVLKWKWNILDSDWNIGLSPRNFKPVLPRKLSKNWKFSKFSKSMHHKMCFS